MPETVLGEMQEKQRIKLGCYKKIGFFNRLRLIARVIGIGGTLNAFPKEPSKSDIELFVNYILNVFYDIGLV